MSLIAAIHWNFSPELFSLGPITVRWYGLMFAISFILGYYMVEKMFKHEKENVKWLDSLLMYLVLATMVGARLGHVFFYAWDYYSENLLEIFFIWQGGLASHGGVIGIFIAMLIYSRKITKKNVFWIIDRVVVPSALAAMFIRLGNLFNSEIYGVETTLPWGFVFERNNELVAKHPTQLYEALAYLFTFGVLQFLYWKTNAKNKLGTLTGVFFIMIFTARFFIEYVKEPQVEFEKTMALNMGQWLSIPFVLVGIGLVVWGKMQKKPAAEQRYKQ